MINTGRSLGCTIRHTDSEDCIDLGQLIALKVEIFFHSRHIGVGQVAAIKLDTIVSQYS